MLLCENNIVTKVAGLINAISYVPRFRGSQALLEGNLPCDAEDHLHGRNTCAYEEQTTFMNDIESRYTHRELCASVCVNTVLCVGLVWDWEQWVCACVRVARSVHASCFMDVFVQVSRTERSRDPSRGIEMQNPETTTRKSKERQETGEGPKR